MRIYIVGGIIFGLIGVAFLISALYSVKDAIYFVQHAETSIGSVINIETRSESGAASGSRATIYSDYALIEFTIPEGTKYSIEKLVYPGLEIAIGDELTLYYLPEDPLNATLDSFWDQYGWLFISLFFGILFSVGGYFGIWEGVKDNVNQRRALKYTIKIEAAVLEVLEQQDNPKVAPHYFVLAEGVHPRTNEKMEFKSRRLKEDPSAKLGKTITVKFHPTKNDVYWVETWKLT